MAFCFQDKETLYLVMDLMPGGDLRYHISRRRRFTEAETRTLLTECIGFFVASIILGLDCIHNNGIIHRDIKPENLVFDANGTSYSRHRLSAHHRLWDRSRLEPEQRPRHERNSGLHGYVVDIDPSP